MEGFAQWLAETSASAVVQKTLWLIPLMQTIHIICVALVFSSVVMIEFRILGYTRSQTIAETAHRYVPCYRWCSAPSRSSTSACSVSRRPSVPIRRWRELLPWTWAGFFAAAVCGSIMILSRPTGYFDNEDFRLKFVCMGLAGLNMLVFQFITSKNVANWDRGRPPLAARVAGALSILLWIGVVYFARMTGFTMVQGGA